MMTSSRMPGPNPVAGVSTLVTLGESVFQLACVIKIKHPAVDFSVLFSRRGFLYKSQIAGCHVYVQSYLQID
jgi:hypothetical protein